MSLPTCPTCQSEYTYQDGFMMICPACTHEWSIVQEDLDIEAASLETAKNAVVDAHGTALSDGDEATVIKDLKVGSNVIKQGTKITHIKLVSQAAGDHDIDCRVDGHGNMYLKSEFLKKV